MCILVYVLCGVSVQRVMCEAVLSSAGRLDAAGCLDDPVLIVGGPDAPLFRLAVELQLERLALGGRLVAVLVRRRIQA